jgi:N-acetylglucosaminyl-diphospho-decaprenol L-rhamnosyltransferase
MNQPSVFHISNWRTIQPDTNEPAMPLLDEPTSLDLVTVIIVTYNSAHCIAALGTALSAIAHIVVVDNGSRDDTVKQVRQRLPRARVIENRVNRGFGAANNLALNEVQTPYALLLNPDCQLTLDNLAHLLDFAESHPEVAILAPQLVDQRGNKDVNYRWPNFSWKSTTGAADGPCCVGFACGACLLFNMALMRPLGFFDETFFLYYEDDDLCTRAFEQRRPIVVLPSATAVHASRGSVGGGVRWRSEYWRGYHHAQSKILYMRKHKGLSEANRLRWRVLAGALLSLPFRVLIFSPRLIGRLWGRVAGLWQLKLAAVHPVRP